MLHVYIWFFQLHCILYQKGISMFCLSCTIFFASHIPELLMMDLSYAFFPLFFFPFLFSGLRHTACQILASQGLNPALCSESAET